MAMEKKQLAWLGQPKADADVESINMIMSRVFSLGRRNSWTPQQVAENIEKKREKINFLIDQHKQQALDGRQV